MSAPGKRQRKICQIATCGRWRKSHGYCATHLQRLQRGEDLLTPIQYRSPRGSCLVEVPHRVRLPKDVDAHVTRVAAKQGLRAPELLRRLATVWARARVEGLSRHDVNPAWERGTDPMEGA